MRTALVLLLLLALAAIPGSVIPQKGVNALAVTQWKDEHPDLTPIYEKLDLFSVYDSIWFSAIYLLLVLSLVGCIVPRLFVYARAFRAQPPKAPRNLSRLPGPPSYETTLPRRRGARPGARRTREARYRLRPDDAGGEGDAGDAVSAERGYLREAGNLLFHLSVLVVLVGVRDRQPVRLPGRRDPGAGLDLRQQPHPVRRLRPRQGCSPRSSSTTSTSPSTTSTSSGSGAAAGAGTARGFDAGLTYHEGDGTAQQYDLRVNHPLSIGDTDVFLIGHGYAPVITVRDGEGNIAYTGPTVFLPQDQSFVSFGVVKAPTAKPGQIGLEGLFYPTFDALRGRPGLGVPRRPQRRWSRCSSTPATSVSTPGPRSRSTPRQDQRRPGQRQGRQAVPARPVGRRDDRAARRPRLGEPRPASSRGSGSRSARRPARRSPWPGVILALIGLSRRSSSAPAGCGCAPGRVDDDGDWATRWLAWGPRSSRSPGSTGPATASWTEVLADLVAALQKERW